MTRQKFEQQMRLMAATWPERAPTAETAAAYWLALQDLHDSTFEAAVAQCLQGCKFYPKPAEIREKAQVLLGAAGTLPPEAEEAWGQVLRIVDRDFHPDCGWMTLEVNGVGRIGGGKSPLSALQEQAVQALGGPSRIWNASHRDLGFIRQEFVEFYGRKREQEMAYGDYAQLGQPLPTRAGALPEGRTA